MSKIKNKTVWYVVTLLHNVSKFHHICIIGMLLMLIFMRKDLKREFVRNVMIFNTRKVSTFCVGKQACKLFHLLVYHDNLGLNCDNK